MFAAFIVFATMFNIYNEPCGTCGTCRVCGDTVIRTYSNTPQPRACYHMFTITEWDGVTSLVHIIEKGDDITIIYEDDTAQTMSKVAFCALKPRHADGIFHRYLGMGLDKAMMAYLRAKAIENLDDLVF